jgi:hypothetical protein
VPRLSCSVMEWITVLEAVDESGKSLSSVRRAVKKLSRESIRKRGNKYLYRRSDLLHELGVEIQSEPVANVSETVTIEPENVSTDSTNSIDIRAELLEAYRSQIQMQEKQIQNYQGTIAQLLERLRESNVISNNYQQRLLAIQEAKPEPVPVVEEKKKEPAWVAWLLITILVTMLGLATYFSWPG